MSTYSPLHSNSCKVVYDMCDVLLAASDSTPGCVSFPSWGWGRSVWWALGMGRISPAAHARLFMLAIVFRDHESLTMPLCAPYDMM